MSKVVETRVVRRGYLNVSVVTLEDDQGVRADREVEDHGASVCVLPYDPDRRVALIVRMARAPVLLAGEGEDLLEAPAGMIDPGETDEQAARRELMEEAGVRLGALERVANVWPSPGVSCERSSLFLAAYGEADRIAAGGGAQGENEGITVAEMALAALWKAAQAGTLTDLKTLAVVLALRTRRADLFDL